MRGGAMGMRGGRGGMGPNTMMGMPMGNMGMGGMGMGMPQVGMQGTHGFQTFSFMQVPGQTTAGQFLSHAMYSPAQASHMLVNSGIRLSIL